MKKQENLSPSSREKIEKMYEAVLSLIREGEDINNMKVADITARAGIGKGTAYEYFENKEEIIANALWQDMAKLLQSLWECNEREKTFREKVFSTFFWIERNLQKRSSGIQFFRVQGGFPEIPGEIVRILRTAREEVCNFKTILGGQIKAARLEKIWSSEFPESAAELTLMSGYIEYFMYLFHGFDKDGFDRENMREYIYQGIAREFLPASNAPEGV